MTTTEWFFSLVPMLAVFGALVFIVRRSGVLELKAHRRRLEELLERIAVAVERRSE